LVFCINTPYHFVTYFPNATKHVWGVCFSFKNNVSEFIKFKYMKINYSILNIFPNSMGFCCVWLNNFIESFFFQYTNKFFAFTFFHK